MKRIVLVLSLVALASLSANATTPKPKYYSFGLTGYCDTFSFYTYSAYSGAPAIAISGQHHCGHFPIETVGGFVHALSSYYQVGTGTVFDFHDSEYSDWYGEPGYESNWIINWKAGTWVLYVTNGGLGYYFVNSGTITAGYQGQAQTQSQGDKPAARR
jgi:hypothetical protein